MCDDWEITPQRQDLPPLMGIIVLVTVAILLFNLIVALVVGFFVLPETDLAGAMMVADKVRVDIGPLVCGERALDVAGKVLLGVRHLDLASSDGPAGSGRSRSEPPRRARASATRPRCSRDFTVPTGIPTIAATSSYGRSCTSWRIITTR